MQRTLSWVNPSKYTDGTDIGTEVSSLKVHVYKDDVEVYTTLPGVTTWPIEVTPGVTNKWQLQSELNGQLSSLSAPLVHSEPFLVPMPPVNLAVS